MEKNKRIFFKLIVTLCGAYLILDLIAKKKKSDSIYEDMPDQKNSLEGKKVVFIEDENDKTNADGIKGHLEPISHVNIKQNFYDKYTKRIIDKFLSFAGLVLLSPIFLVTSLAIKIEDPGPVFFTQKRIGENKKYFKIHKFRSMKMDTPSNVPTHMLANPDQYITRVGKFLRSHSLDELPQIWDIFLGNMSIIGPRPALWNQDKLTALRDLYGANDVKPGLTGWAQINGRDELELEEKAKLDGEYVQNRGLLMDMKCFMKSIHVFGKDESIHEGKTDNKSENPSTFSSLPDKETKTEKKKKIVITGANSYIGDSVKNYLLEENSERYEVEIIDTRGLRPTVDMFQGFDVVFNVAGIAHIKESPDNQQLYFDINRDLVIKMAEAAKEAGVKQFIMLSSMSVYGLVTGYITKDMQTNPLNAYGQSKSQADEVVKMMADDRFIVSILRPPMVYGKDCKGNYQLLRKFALKSKFFPGFMNNRSMIYIGNLCEFVKRIIDLEQGGLFFPQNSEYVSTSQMVRFVSEMHNKTIIETRIFNLFIKILPMKMLKKVFGNLTYEQVDTVSKYNFKESIELTEGYRNEM